jgi:hypothetical protein
MARQMAERDNVILISATLTPFVTDYAEMIAIFKSEMRPLKLYTTYDFGQQEAFLEYIYERTIDRNARSGLINALYPLSGFL